MLFLTEKFCYIIIPKNASRSIISKLNVERIDTGELQFLSNWYKKEIPFSFTFTRNPYNRALTSYRHAIKEEWINKTMTFTNYLKLLKCIYIDCDLVNKNDIFKDENIKLTIRDKISKKTNLHLPLYDTYNIKMIIDHSFPQYKYIVNNDEKIIVDFIGRYERLNEDWNKLCSIFKTVLNLNLDNKLPLLNERGDSCYNINPINKCFSLKYDETNKHHTDETKKLIYEIYKKDFELLNYDKNDVPLKKEINFKIEKNFNDSYFNLFNSRNKKDEKIKYKLCLDLFDKLKNAFPKAEKDDLVSMNLNNMKMMSNNQKIDYLLGNAVIWSMHIFPKYPM